jgi:uncharacterized protein (DUF362 family)/Pyruvate/2-oxoacid:ferredoxin oxidoreductase delta subunit
MMHVTFRKGQKTQGERMSIVSVLACDTYDGEAVRRLLSPLLAPLGGMGAFVRPGMRVLLKPNLLSAAEREKAVTTHPAVVRAVAELVQGAGGTVLIGDSPAGPIGCFSEVWRTSGMAEIAAALGAPFVPFDEVIWRRLDGQDYFVARPVLEADLVINLPKLKTHAFARYTGAVKNLFGIIPGGRKREIHMRAPGIAEFSRALVDVLELVRPGLTIMDGVTGQEGEGPGTRGTPRPYGCLAASTDPVALDSALSAAMGFRHGQVLHVAQAASRGLGVSEPDAIQIQGDKLALRFGRVKLPATHWYFRVPSWLTAPVARSARLQPVVEDQCCAGCGQCALVCPRDAITPGQPPHFDPEACVGCMCCAEICPQGAIRTHQNWLGRLIGTGS